MIRALALLVLLATSCAGLPRKPPPNPYSVFKDLWWAHEIESAYDDFLAKCDLRHAICPAQEEALRRAKKQIALALEDDGNDSEMRRLSRSIDRLWPRYRATWLPYAYPEIAAKECPRDTRGYVRERAEAIALVDRLRLLVDVYQEQLQLCQAGDPPSCDSLQLLRQRYRSLAATTSREIRLLQQFSLQDPKLATEDVAERFLLTDQRYSEALVATGLPVDLSATEYARWKRERRRPVQ